MLHKLRHFLELIRFSHTVFALPFALLSAVLAWAQPDSVFRLRDLIGILICMVTARSAAMAFNRLVDRDIDADNPRTAKRHIPAGLLSARAVTLFTIVMCIVHLLYDSQYCFIVKKRDEGLNGNLAILSYSIYILSIVS